jgi:hypothetical protein
LPQATEPPGAVLVAKPHGADLIQISRDHFAIERLDDEFQRRVT